MDQIIASKSESLLNAIILYHRLYVYTRCKHGIQAKKIFDEHMPLHNDTCPSLNTSFRGIKDIHTGCFEVRKGEFQGDTYSLLMLQMPRK